MIAVFFLRKKGQVWYLIVSIPDLCTLTYFGHSTIYATATFFSILKNYFYINFYAHGTFFADFHWEHYPADGQLFSATANFQNATQGFVFI